MHHIDEFRDPKFDPRPGDEVSVDLGDGDVENRKVVSIERHGSGPVVRCHINGDTLHTRCIRLRDWREMAEDSEVIDAALE